MGGYRVWECEIVVAADAVMPDGFDWPPRQAAIDAVGRFGVEVISCFSGWGGTLTEAEKRGLPQ